LATGKEKSNRRRQALKERVQNLTTSPAHKIHETRGKRRKEERKLGGGKKGREKT
jgi:hypothetical protein